MFWGFLFAGGPAGRRILVLPTGTELRTVLYVVHLGTAVGSVRECVVRVQCNAIQ